MSGVLVQAPWAAEGARALPSDSRSPPNLLIQATTSPALGMCTDAQKKAHPERNTDLLRQNRLALRVVGFDSPGPVAQALPVRISCKAPKRNRRVKTQPKAIGSGLIHIVFPRWLKKEKANALPSVFVTELMTTDNSCIWASLKPAPANGSQGTVRLAERRLRQCLLAKAGSEQ